MEIGKVSMVVEIDGEACAVVLPQERMRMLVNLAASLADNGSLPVRKLDKRFSLEEMDFDEA